MIKYILFIPVLALALSSCGHTGPGGRAGADSTALPDDAPPSGDFYKRFEGTIGGRPVVVHLQRYGADVRGSYQYTSAGQLLTINNWEDSVHDETLYLTEASNEEDAATGTGAHWSLVIRGKSATGKWMGGDSTKTQDIDLKEAYPQGSFPLAALAYSDTTRLYAGRPEPHAYTSYGIVTPGGGWAEGQSRYVSAAIGKQLGLAAAGGGEIDFKAGLRAQAEKYFQSYRREMRETIDSNAPKEEFESFAYKYYSTEQLYVIYNNKGWLVLEDLCNRYTGGAHGNYNSAWMNLDVTGSRSWAINDIITDTTALRPMLNDAAIRYFKLKPGDAMGERLLVAEVPPTGNFYLTQTGITFVYNPYEIASYADGEVNLFLPYKKLMPLLTAAFKERMGLVERAGVAML